MIWLTWRQLRLNLAVVSAVVLAVVVLMLVTGPHLADVYAERAATFFDEVGTEGTQALYVTGVVAAYVVPGVIGVFWGAPMLARELEAGTHRLVWAQSVTRTGWLATKLGLGLAGAVAAGGLIGLAATWWSQPIDSAINAGDAGPGLFSLARIGPEIFAGRGIVPIGYAVFAFALGVTAGALIRRTVPAMAVTLVVYAFVQIAMPLWVRPHLVAPEQEPVAITAESLHGLMGQPGHIEELDVAFDRAGSWTLRVATVDSSGRVVTPLPDWLSECLPPPRTKAGPASVACFDRLVDQGYRQRFTYHPADRYWPLQWRETGLLAAGALLLGAGCFWRVRRLS